MREDVIYRGIKTAQEVAFFDDDNDIMVMNKNNSHYKYLIIEGA